MSKEQSEKDGASLRYLKVRQKALADELVGYLRHLAEDLEFEAKKVEKNLYASCSTGIIQQRGSRIASLCGQLDALREAIEQIEADSQA